VGSLERRMKNLEAALVPGECPVCGLDLNAPPEYDVVFEDTEGEDLEPLAEEEPECCDGCGRQLEYVVVWDDLVHHERKEQERGDELGDEGKAAGGGR
jgi:hypothetical protein